MINWQGCPLAGFWAPDFRKLNHPQKWGVGRGPLRTLQNVVHTCVHISSPSSTCSEHDRVALLWLMVLRNPGQNLQPLVLFQHPGKNSTAWQACVVEHMAKPPGQQTEERSYQNPTVPSVIAPLKTSCWALLPEETVIPLSHSLGTQPPAHEC